jgi:hypothetical protein
VSFAQAVVTETSQIDWDNNDMLREQVFKQQELMQSNLFDPFAYFGALEMPKLDPSRSAHPRIAEIF